MSQTLGAVLSRGNSINSVVATQPAVLSVEGSLAFDPQRLERVFAQCFAAQLNTVLQGGHDEPFYRPSDNSQEQALICYRGDYFASALHEVAHWCIAGAARRQSPDYGYWYAPEGRDESQQQAFEAVESKPQALEWCFSIACGYNFKISPDNLDSTSGEIRDSSSFKQAVADRANHWKSAGLPSRAEVFFAALAQEFATVDGSGEFISMKASNFDSSELVG